MKTKRQLSPAQVAARDERRQSLIAMNKKISAMTPAERDALTASFGTILTCEGRALSPRNSMLVWMQLGATASVVGGFNQWQKVGRRVMPGQHGAQALVPLGRKVQDASGEVSTTDDGEGMHFTTTTYFDVTQTETMEAAAARRAELCPA